MDKGDPQSPPSIDVGKPPLLSYASPPATGAPAWVWVVIATYLILIVALIASPFWLYKVFDVSFGLIGGAAATALILCGLALLWIPMRVARRRPLTQQSIFVPITAAGLLLGGLVLGGGWALAELCAPAIPVNRGGWAGTSMEHTPTDNTLWAIVGASVIVWIAWFIIFAIVARRRDPAGLGMKLHRMLIAGSVLELLVAVPSHIIVRRRNECCAGILTGTGICLGVAIAIISFGPAVFLLYHRRCRQIAPHRGMGVSPM
jgi:hypothetical protein